MANDPATGCDNAHPLLWELSNLYRSSFHADHDTLAHSEGFEPPVFEPKVLSYHTLSESASPALRSLIRHGRLGEQRQSLLPPVASPEKVTEVSAAHS